MRLQQRYTKTKLSHKIDSDELFKLETEIDEALYYNNIAIQNSIINYNNPEYNGTRTVEPCMIGNYYHEYDNKSEHEIYDVATDDDSDMDDDTYNNINMDENPNDVDFRMVNYN